MVELKTVLFYILECHMLTEQVMRQMEKSCWTLMIVSLYSLVTNIFFKLSRKTVTGLFPADSRCAYFPAILKICNIPSEKIFLIRNLNKCGEIPNIVSATCQSQLCNLIWLIGATISQIHSNINMCITQDFYKGQPNISITISLKNDMTQETQ